MNKKQILTLLTSYIELWYNINGTIRKKGGENNARLASRPSCRCGGVDRFRGGAGVGIEEERWRRGYNEIGSGVLRVLCRFNTTSIRDQEGWRWQAGGGRG